MRLSKEQRKFRDKLRKRPEHSRLRYLANRKRSRANPGRRSCGAVGGCGKCYGVPGGRGWMQRFDHGPAQPSGLELCNCSCHEEKS